MQRKEIKINKQNIKYNIFKSKKNQSILILHGWRWSSDSWYDVSKILQKSWYNVFVPDIPWASKNTKCDKVYNIDDYAIIVEEFVEKLKKTYKNINFNKLIIWGHSNWWAIAIKLANRKKIKIQKLVLNNSAWIRNDTKRNLKRKILNITAKAFNKINFLKNKKIYILEKIKKLFYKVIWNYDYLEAIDNPNLKNTYLNMIACDLKEEIKNINIETLILWWEKDKYTPLRDWYFMKENIKKSKIVVLKNKNHSIHLKDPKILVKHFL